jgi:hypothetical protein
MSQPTGPRRGTVLEITLADATWVVAGSAASTALYLSDGIAYARGSRYEPRISDWSDCRRGFDVRASNLQHLEMTVTVADEDRAIRDALENGQQRGSPAAIWDVYPDGDVDDVQRVFEGVLDRWAYRRGETDLILRTDDLALRNYVPTWAVTKSEWPNAPTASVGYLVPILYGTHNSSGLSGTGMLTAVPVDWTASTIGWYVVCAGEAKEILAVYQNGTAKTITTHYTIDYALSRAGKVYTVIKFTGGNIPAAGDVITCDARGYETSGNTGSGTTAPSGILVTNPVEQMRHLLVNFAELAWQSGAWHTVASSALVDAESWAACVQWAEQQQLEGAGYVGGGVEPQQVWDVLNAWLDTWGVFRAYWTAEGKIGLAVLDLGFPGYRSSSDPPLVRTEDELETSAEYEMDTTNLSDEFIASYLYDEAQGQYLGSLTVIDPSAPASATSSQQMLWAIRRAT